MQKSTLMYKGLLASTSALSILGGTLGAKAATLVDIELALVIDGSGSISQQVFDDHIDAIDAIFNDANFYEHFVKPLGDNPSLAFGLYQFGTVENILGEHEIAIDKISDWTLFNQDNQSGIDLSNVQKLGGFTPIGNVIDQISKELLNNDYEGHKVMNISTDGFNNSSTINPLRSARQAFIDNITLNALALPSYGSFVEGNGTEKEYDEDFLRMLSDPYSVFGVQRKNFDGDPAFVMLDYVTGEKTLADALRLKVVEETTGSFSLSFPTPEDPTPNPSGDGAENPTPNSSGDGTEDPTTDPIFDPNAGAENIPEPSSLFGLLTIGVWRLYKQYKKSSD